MDIKTHKDLNVWKRSIEFVTKIYSITTKFPYEEKYGLVQQMRRSAVSIPSNIAEGAARHSIKEYIQFLYISLSFLSELETQLIISEKLKFITDHKKQLLDELVVIRKQLLALIKSLKKS